MELNRWFGLFPPPARTRALPLLMNYVKLEPGVPTKLHFTDDYYVERDIPERESGKTKRVRGLVLWVDELNGEPAARNLSILSQKLAAHLEPYLKDKRYEDYDFIITEMGEGFYKDWNVQTIRRQR